MPIRYPSALACAVFLPLWYAGTAHAQQSVDLAPSQDNTLFEDANGALSNGSGAYLFAGRTNGDALRRALVAFDVAATVPAGVTIDSVRLTLNLSKTNPGTGPQAISLHRVLAAWGEGTSDASLEEGLGADATANDATWLHTFFNTGFWATPGGDFKAEASAVRTVDAEGVYTWGSTSGMTADVQAWLDAPAENFGWMLRSVETPRVFPTAKRFDSREHTEPAVRPALHVFFSRITAVEAPDGVPAAVRFLQNHPNPFAGSTTLSYKLSGPQQVRLSVYNVVGRRVATLVNALQRAGTHRVAFTPGPLPPGLYIYRLTTERAVLHQTMTLLR